LKLWDKLLESAVHEAIAEQKEGADGSALTETQVKTWLEEAESAEVQKEAHPADNMTLKRDAKKTVRFDTLMPAAKGKDQAKEGEWIHRSILSKEGITPVAAAPRLPVLQNGPRTDNSVSPRQQAIPMYPQR
jgi:hypothetical protein